MIENQEEQWKDRQHTSLLRGPIRWLSGVLCDRPAPNRDEMPGMPPGGKVGVEGDGEDGPMVIVSLVSEIPASISPLSTSCTARTLLSCKRTSFFYYARRVLAKDRVVRDNEKNIYISLWMIAITVTVTAKTRNESFIYLAVVLQYAWCSCHCVWRCMVQVLH